MKQEPNAIWSGKVVWVAVGICLLAMLTAAAFRGPWVDEAWSSYLARHDLPLSTIMSERWGADPHPPLFSFLTWLVQPLTGDDIVPKRFLNLVPLAFAGLASLWVARRQSCDWPVVAAVFAIGSTVVLDTFADHRMYFTFHAALYVGCLLLAFVQSQDRDMSRQDLPAAYMLAGSIFLLLNLQYVYAMFAGIILAVFLVQLWSTGKRAWAYWILACTFLSGVMITATFLFQWRELSGTVAQFWVHSSLRDALQATATAFVFSLIPYVAAIAALALHPGSDDWRRRFALTAATGVGLALIAAFGLNAVRPFIVRHYMYFIAAPMAVSFAVLVTPALRHRKLWAYLVLANVVLASCWLGFRRANQPQANELGRFAAATVAACPATQVVGVGYWTVQHERPFKNDSEVIDWLYHLIGRKMGFEVISPEQWRKASSCPTIIWIENVATQPTAAQLATAVRLDIPASSINAATRRVGSAGLAVLYPAQTPGSTLPPKP